MFFSIIIPTFNCSFVLSNCIDSLLTQTFNDFEVLILDGESTDDTLVIANHYAQNDVRIKIFSEKDKGIYDAMNKGIGLAKGEYVYFLGSDDALYDRFVLENVFDYLKDHARVDFFYGCALLKNSNILYDGIFDIEKLIFNNNICHQAIFYRRDLFNKMGLYDLKYPIFSDWDFNIRCFKNPTVKIEYCNMIIAYFNDGKGVSKSFDPVFSKELPAYYIKDNEFKTSYVEAIKSSLSYRIGKAILYPFSITKRLMKKYF